MSRVFVAMSGGVDSSVAAALLAEADHDVVGVTMQLLPSGDHESGCCSTSAVRDAHRVCDHLGVPHYTLNFRDVFRSEVIETFCDAYADGRTPNPCIVCNDRVKFLELWRRASQQGADFLATGHYARIVRDQAEEPWLARGLDVAKDQSYFLYRMTREQLERTLFPVGELTKAGVRRIAAERALPTAEAPESQDICFVPDDTASFLGRERPSTLTRGNVVDREGRILGEHAGIGRYTVGQRKGLPASGAGRLYVLEVRPGTNEVVVGPPEALEVRRLVCGDVVWRGDTHAEVTAQTRYRGRLQRCRADFDGERLTLTFETPIPATAPGQAAVCYQGDLVLGGGVIEESG